FALGVVADGALRGERHPPLDGVLVGLGLKRLFLLLRKVGRDLVQRGLKHVFRVGLHFRGRALSFGIVLDRLLEIGRRHAGQNGHRGARAVPAEAVAGAADQRLGGARRVQRTGRGGERRERQSEGGEKNRQG